jgi:hypothetical protein
MKNGERPRGEIRSADSGDPQHHQGDIRPSAQSCGRGEIHTPVYYDSSRNYHGNVGSQHSRGSVGGHHYHGASVPRLG